MRIYDRSHANTQREETLKMREAGRPVPERITPQARQVVEMLSGMSYESLWGNNNIGYLNRHKQPAHSATQVTQH